MTRNSEKKYVQGIQNILSSLSKKATLGTEESGRCEELAIMERLGCNKTMFLGGVQHVYCAKVMVTKFHNGNPVINDI